MQTACGTFEEYSGERSRRTQRVSRAESRRVSKARKEIFQKAWGFLKSMKLDSAPSASTSLKNKVQTVTLRFFPACQNSPVGQA